MGTFMCSLPDCDKWKVNSQRKTSGRENILPLVILAIFISSVAFTVHIENSISGLPSPRGYYHLAQAYYEQKDYAGAEGVWKILRDYPEIFEIDMTDSSNYTKAVKFYQRYALIELVALRRMHRDPLLKRMFERGK